MTKLVLGWVENIVGKGENPGYQHFLLFPQSAKYRASAFHKYGNMFEVKFRKSSVIKSLPCPTLHLYFSL